MAGKTKNMSEIKQLLRLHKQGEGKRSIARTLNISKNTVKEYLNKLSASKLSIEMLLLMEEPSLEKFFHPGNPAYKDNRFEELRNDFEYIVKELGKTGVTRTLLWEEYRLKTPDGYSLSQFNHHLSQYLLKKNPSLPLTHNPGEKLFVDFAGKTISYIDKETGEIINCQVFVACMPYSDYGFCMAVRSQKVNDFIYALEHCLRHFGGSPQVLVPDNLKSAVIKSDRYEPSINTVLNDFANHYNMSVVPARAKKPKDKALVENQVKLIYNRVYARLRDRQFFSIHELNEAMAEKTKIHNQTRMQQKDYCREECFLSEEKPLLNPLPENAFEIKCYRNYTVAKNNHIYLTQDKHYYSVPYQYIGEKVKVIYTPSIVKIYHNAKQIVVHQRNYQQGKYTTIKEHLCSTHQHYLNRSPDYYKDKALKISPVFHELIEKLFNTKQYPEQLYRTCDGLFSLSKKTDADVFEKACKKALEHNCYKFYFLQNIIRNKTYENDTSETTNKIPKHQNLRGAEYYK